jgi:hypothetical protein
MEADRFRYLMREFVATTLNELYDELHFALTKDRQGTPCLPRDNRALASVTKSS